MLPPRRAVISVMILFTLAIIGATVPTSAADFLVACNPIGLIAGINTANSTPEEDTLNLTAGCTYSFTAAEDVDMIYGNAALPSVVSPIIINGNGAIIERVSGSPDFRLLHVRAEGDLTLNGVTVRGGIAASGGPLNNGGGILVYEGVLTVADSTITSNTAASGGGIASVLGDVTVTDSTISGNTATSSGTSTGGGILNNSGVLTVIDSTISGNIVSSPVLTVGGGIYNATGTLTLMNSMLSGNIAEYGGGIQNGTGTVTIINSTFAGNQGGSDGGGIHNSTGTVTLTNSIVWGNSGIQIGGSASTVTYSIVEGGHAGTGNLNVDPQFVAPVAHGSAPTTTGDYHIQPTSPAIDAGNSAAVPVDLLTDIDGDARIIGAAVDIGADESFDICTAYTFPYTVAAGDTAAFVQAIQCANANPDESVINLTAGSTYSFTSAADIDGVLGDSALPRITTPVVINGDGATIERGGGSPDFRLLRIASGGDLTLNNVTLTGGNSGEQYGGGVYAVDGTLSVVNSTLTDNSSGYYGGGIYAVDGTLSVVNSTLSGNSAGYYGGGIYVRDGTLSVVNSTLSGNSVGQYGGGIYAVDGTLSVVNSTLSGNNGVAYGGGIRVRDSTLSVINSTIAGNRAINGGGVHNTDGTVTITNSIVWGNNSQIDGTATVTYSIVEGGYAGTGNLNADPQFVAPVAHASAPTTAGDYRLQASSPALNVGSNAALPADTFDLDGDSDTSEPLPIDLDGNLRVVNVTVDLGAYEHQAAAGVTISATAVNVAEGGATDTYTVVLVTQPSADVTIALATGGQAAVDQPVLTFTSANWNVPQTVMVAAVDDAFFEGAHTDTITHTVTSTDAAYNGMTAAAVTVNILDDELPAVELIRNGGFEDDLDNNKQPDEWRVKGKASTKLICNPAKANTGSCAFRFKRGTAVRGQLIQSADLTGLTFSVGDTLTLSTYMRDFSNPGKVQVIMTVLYTTGVPQKYKQRLAHDGAYMQMTLPPVALTAADVREIRVKFLHKTANGAVMMDDVSLIYMPVGSGRSGGGGELVLPPPVAPEGFRGTN